MYSYVYVFFNVYHACLDIVGIAISMHVSLPVSGAAKADPRYTNELVFLSVAMATQ